MNEPTERKPEPSQGQKTDEVSGEIICLAFPAFEGDYLKSTVQLMRQLALRHRVLFVDYAYTWKDFFKSIFGKSRASWLRMLGLKNPLRKIPGAGELHVLTLPPVFPTHFLTNPKWFDRLNALNARLLERRIRRAAAQLDFEKPVVVNALNPIFGTHLAGRLGEKRLVYYCYDEIGAAPWVKKHGARLERIFLGQVDAVVVSSKGLLRQKSLLHADCRLIRNGVDFELFAREIPRGISERILPEKQPGQTVFGYLGSVDKRLDFVLLEKTARRFPGALLVLVGRVEATGEAVERLRALKNVVFTGPKPPETLPAWVRMFDVGLIPFLKNDLTAGIYPLKINEYLAAGRPVVAMHFADMTDFEAVVEVADDAEAFLRALSKISGAVGDARARARRVAFAERNSWAARARAFEVVVFGEKNAPGFFQTTFSGSSGEASAGAFIDAQTGFSIPPVSIQNDRSPQSY